MWHSWAPLVVRLLSFLHQRSPLVGTVAGSFPLETEAGSAYSLVFPVQGGCHIQTFCRQAMFGKRDLFCQSPHCDCWPAQSGVTTQHKALPLYQCNDGIKQRRLHGMSSWPYPLERSHRRLLWPRETSLCFVGAGVNVKPCPAVVKASTQAKAP